MQGSGFQTVLRVPVGLQGGTRIDLLSVFLHKKYIHSYIFCLPGSVNKFLNFCVAYFPCWFLKMAIILSHSIFFMLHLRQFWFFKRLIEWYLAHWLILEQGCTCWQQLYAISKSLGTTGVASSLPHATRYTSNIDRSNKEYTNTSGSTRGIEDIYVAYILTLAVLPYNTLIYCSKLL